MLYPVRSLGEEAGLTMVIFSSMTSTSQMKGSVMECWTGDENSPVRVGCSVSASGILGRIVRE
jgi:hypothetical protein